jgi:hypothetical protein
MDGVETHDSIRTPTITTTLSHETVNANIEGPTDTPQLMSLSPSHNLMTLSYLATSISPSFSLQSYGFQGTQLSGRVEQQPIDEITRLTMQLDLLYRQTRNIIYSSFSSKRHLYGYFQAAITHEVLLTLLSSI